MKRLGRPPYSCLITRGLATTQNFESEKAAILEAFQHAAADGVSMVQIREKALPGRMLFDLATAAVETLAGTPTLVIVNDRPDVAVTAGADGVHLPANSFPAIAVRRAFGNALVIGVSTHTLQEALSAADSAADYIFFGPVFETPGKGPAAGLGRLTEVADAVAPFPVVALGGIDHDNLSTALATGACGIAAIRSMHEQDSRRRICERLGAM